LSKKSPYSAVARRRTERIDNFIFAVIRFFGMILQEEGKAASGQYDLVMHINDVSRGLTYPVGTFRQGPPGPGDNIPWMRKKFRVNDPGAFQYYIEIRPFAFKDNNEQNNKRIYAFTVK
jgi:hypothetical protein